MAGEMSVADLKDYPLHQTVADAVGGELRPFDVYIGPYILIEGHWVFLDDDSVTLWWQGQAPYYAEPEVVDLGWAADVENYVMAITMAIQQAKERARWTK